MSLRRKENGLWDRREEKLINACHAGNLKTVKSLLSSNIFQKRIDINLSEGYLLRLASERGFVDIVSLLNKSGADVNLRTSRKWVSYFATMSGTVYGKTPIMLASINGHKKVVELLINAGADVNAKANTDADYQEYFLNSYTHLCPPKNPYETALILSSKNGHPEIVELLKMHGAKSDQLNYNGWL